MEVLGFPAEGFPLGDRARCVALTLAGTGVRRLFRLETGHGAGVQRPIRLETVDGAGVQQPIRLEMVDGAGVQRPIRLEMVDGAGRPQPIRSESVDGAGGQQPIRSGMVGGGGNNDRFGLEWSAAVATRAGSRRNKARLRGTVLVESSVTGLGRVSLGSNTKDPIKSASWIEPRTVPGGKAARASLFFGHRIDRGFALATE